MPCGTPKFTLQRVCLGFYTYMYDTNINVDSKTILIGEEKLQINTDKIITTILLRPSMTSAE